MHHEFWRGMRIGGIIILCFGLSVSFANQVFLSMGGGSRGGTFDTFGLGVSDILWRSIDGFNLSLVQSAGSGKTFAASKRAKWTWVLRLQATSF